MTYTRNLAWLIAGAALLAACSKPVAGGGPQAAAAGSPAAAGSTSSSSELPDIKTGLWEIHMAHTSSTGEAHSGVSQQCMSPEAMAEAKKTAADYVKANCSKNETTGGAGQWVSELVCKVGAKTMTTRSVTAMPEPTAYHTVVTATFEPPDATQGTNTTTMDGKWLGPCKPT